MILTTGTVGFIGSNFIHSWFAAGSESAVSLDKLTYAGNLANLKVLKADSSHTFIQGDIGDRVLVRNLLIEYRPRAVINFAAESHVDSSIHEPGQFIQTNVWGMFNLLEAVLEYWAQLPAVDKSEFRFLNVSSDEVFGSLKPKEAAFTEGHQYQPNNPYSASKAASDHLVRAWRHTYSLPTITTNCSNNYGPYHFPEKLIPLIILNALAGKVLPIYGDGQQVRDWLYVEDHCSALRRVLEAGRVGETYNIGSRNEKTNLEVVHAICAILDELQPKTDGSAYANQITFVKDRPGHDRRYAVDASKIERELDWKPRETFESGIRKTVQWYLDNEAWIEGVTSGAYRLQVNMPYGS